MISSMISDRVKKVKPSPTMAMNAKANELKAQGADIVNLSAGEPDFDTPDYIKQAGIHAIEQGHTRYTAAEGTPELRQAICEKFKRDNNLEYSPQQVIVTSGGKFSTYLLMQAIMNRGDKVIIPAPYWVSFPPMVELADGEPIIVQTSAKNGFKLTPDDLKNVDLTGVKAIILNSPSNPSGVVYERNELEELLTPLVKKGIMIVSDEMYEDMVFEGHFTSIASISEEFYQNTITLNGVSKSHSMTGWRIGYAAGNIDIIKAMGKIAGQSTSNPTSISQKAAVEAIKSGKYVKGALMDTFVERRDFVYQAFLDIGEFSVVKPHGAFYIFPELSEKLQQAACKARPDLDAKLAFGTLLLEKYHTAVVPGEGFGMDNCFRVSFATDLGTIREGMKRIKQAVDDLLGR